MSMTLESSVQKIVRGTTEIINLDGLKKKLKTKKNLCVKAGFDPTAPDIHLGHVVLLRKLRHFQELGHTVSFLIGDFTAQIGDPTGKDQLRSKLDRATVKKNAETYKKQVFKVLDPKKTKVVFNSQWLDKLKAQEILELTACCTVAQMLARADFKKRYEEGKEISLLEFAYPLLQGYDSVHLKADIELGGSDQKFNLLMGRQLQEVYGQEPQVVIMTPLIEGTDGVQKMSKSLDNYIGINESPKDMFGKIMSISDELMMKYYECLTDCDLDVVKTMHPKEAKMKLAETIVTQFHDEKKATEERKNFEKTFSQGGVPDDAPEFRVKNAASCCLLDILVDPELGLAPSKKEARRLLQQGAVSHEGIKISDENWTPKTGILRVGKRKFVRILAGP